MKARERMGFTGVFFLALAALATCAYGQALTITTDTTETGVQSYNGGTIKGNATYTVNGSGAAVTVTNANFLIGDYTAGNSGSLVVTNGASFLCGSTYTVLSSPDTSVITSRIAVCGGSFTCRSLPLVQGWSSLAGYAAGRTLFEANNGAQVGLNGLFVSGYAPLKAKVILTDGAVVVCSNSVKLAEGAGALDSLLYIAGTNTRFTVTNATAGSGYVAAGVQGTGTVTVTDGAVVTSSGSIQVGMPGSSSYKPAVGYLTMEKGAVWTCGSSANLGALNVGRSAFNFYNGIGYVVLRDPGTWLFAGQSMYVGSSGNVARSSVIVSNSALLEGIYGLEVGQADVLVTSGGTLQLGSQGMLVTNYSGTVGGTVSNIGGVFQFKGAAPAMVTNGGGSVVIQDGTIAFRDINNATLLGNQTGTLTNMTFLGNNAFRLNNASNTTSGQDYFFNTGLGATNYCRLELAGGTTRYQGGTPRIGSGGVLWFSNTLGTIDNAVTNLGVVSFANATGTFSKALLNYGRLEGGGTVVGNVTNYSGSAVAPGGTNGMGTLTLDGTNVLPAGAALVVELGSSTSQYDRVVLKSGRRFEITGSTLQITLKAAPKVDDAYMIISNDAGNVVGQFANSHPMVDFGGQSYPMYVQYDGGDGNDVVVKRWGAAGAVIVIR